MKKFYLLLIAIFTINIANAQWQQCNGPNGGNIKQVAIYGSKYYAVVQQGGIYLSTDRGNSWTASNTGLGLDVMDVNTIAIKGDTLFAGTFHDHYRSTDGGNNWTIISYVSDVLTYTFNGNDIFAGTNHGVYLSSNNGDSWVSINNGIPISTTVYNIIISGSTIFAGTDKGVYISSNYGTSWTAMNNGFPSSISIFSFIKNGNNVYAGTSYGLYKTSDGGNNWTATSTNTNYISSLILYNNKIYAGTGNGVSFSQNNGVDWNSMGLSNISIATIAINGDTILAGSSTSLYLSTDYGSNWASKNTNISSTDVRSLFVNGNNLYAGTYSNGISLSSDDGNSWNNINIGYANNPAIYSLAANGNNIYAGTTDYGLLMSTNNGSTWAVNTAGMIQGVYKIIINGNKMFAGTSNGVYVSTNNGSTWSQSGIIGPTVLTLAASGNKIVAGAYEVGVYISTDNGLSWTLTSTPSTLVYSLAINGNNIYAGCYNDGLFRSTDNGNTWTNLGMQFAAVNSLLVSGNYLIAGTYDGVSLSTDNGDNWTDLGAGPILFTTLSLAFHNNYIFAGTEGYGIWRLSIKDTIITSANQIIGGTTSGDGIFTINQTCTVQASPKPYYSFVNWTENGNIVSTDSIYTFVVISNRNVIANFILNCSAQFALIADTTTPHHYFAVNNASGTAPLKYLWSWGDGTSDTIAYPSHTYDTAGYYTICLTITDSTGCTHTYCDSSYLQKSTNSIITINVIPQGTLGINTNVLTNQIKIYPNPTKDNLTIETNSNNEQRLEIVNLIGQTVYTTFINNNKATINTSAFAKGVYILKLSSDKETVVRKFVKE